VIEARPIGIFRMRDRELADDKILAVPATDPLFDNYREIDDIPPHFLEEVEHFFSVYKDLQHERIDPIEWEGRQAALDEIERSLELYAQYLRSSH
jgi:inorganic pyrophosphatase